ncbi:Cytochrome b5 [Anthophora plagiata]
MIELEKTFPTETSARNKVENTGNQCITNLTQSKLEFLIPYLFPRELFHYWYPEELGTRTPIIPLFPSSNDSTVEGMDLLSLTFRSLDLRCNNRQPEDFLRLEKKNVVEKDEASKQHKRRSIQTTDEIRLSSRNESKQLKTINMDEVAWHDTVDNCWIVIHDFVYDCTDFLNSHPGGSDVILEYAGRDATLAFIGTGHSSMARQSLERYLIGELPPEERIFRVPNGVKLAGF